MRRQKSQRERRAAQPRQVSSAVHVPLRIQRTPPRRHVARTGRLMHGAGH